ncbi:MAG: UDP-N-acetylglucosamine 1-carboxyvinyltransferase [Anaerolineae bacterium]|nr:UDP-N-acetylglucosamine 1-carboxyvinyltransferase [Anaerolineae bacterium]MDW8098127.1 UDP-N-acetylglucosamine 1-carboxyvinyltransferase [Anaerolineae bacterium]
MARFVIHGRRPLNGAVTPSGNKNAALPLLAASLLTDQPIVLHNVPRIGDVLTMLQLLQMLGVEVHDDGSNTITLQARRIVSTSPDPDLFGLIRGSITLLGPMLARVGHIYLPMPGGDRIGRRRIDTHVLAMRALGAQFDYDDRLEVRADRLRGQDILLDEASVTATENAVMAAVLAEGTTIVRNAACEPHVQDLCHFLNCLGARIQGIGSNTLIIEGVSSLHGGEFTISPDFLEIGSFIGLGAVTEGELRIRNVIPDQLRMILMVFRDRLGVRLHFEGNDLVIEDQQDLHIVPDLGGAVPKIDDAPWPAFPADLMSIALVVATQARGTVLIHEKMFESRLYFVDRLIAMGAQIILCDPHRCVVVGPSRLHGTSMSSPDIRAGMALVIAALCAEGQSVIGNIGQIDRGYENVDQKLRALGADIVRLED